MKSGVPTLVDGCQTEGALEVLSKEADRAGSQMETIPPLENYSFPPTKAGDQDLKAQSEFGPTTSDVYRRNASLALQVSFTLSFALPGFPSPSLSSQLLSLLQATGLHDR